MRDRFTLADVTYLAGGAYQFFNTNGRNLSAAQQTQQAVGMQNMLQAVLPGDVVTVQGISNTQSGEGGLDRPLVGAISADAMNALTQEIVGLGGTRDTFNAPPPPGDDELEPRSALRPRRLAARAGTERRARARRPASARVSPWR